MLVVEGEDIVAKVRTWISGKKDDTKNEDSCRNRRELEFKKNFSGRIKNIESNLRKV
jgi:hypothetical protein